MEYIRKNLKSILIVSILAVGLAVGMYLVKNPKIFKSKATSEAVDRISGTSSDGSEVQKLNPDQIRKLELPGAVKEDESTIPTFKVKGKQFTIRYSQ